MQAFSVTEQITKIAKILIVMKLIYNGKNEKFVYLLHKDYFKVRDLMT